MPGERATSSRLAQLRTAFVCCVLLVLGAAEVSGQTVAIFSAPFLVNSYTWTVTIAASDTAVGVARGEPVELTYTVTVARTLVSSFGFFDVVVTCPRITTGTVVSVILYDVTAGAPKLLQTASPTAGSLTVPFSVRQTTGALITGVAASCTDSSGNVVPGALPAVGPTLTIAYTGSPVLIQGSARVKGEVVFPTWTTIGASGAATPSALGAYRLFTPPTTALVRGTALDADEVVVSAPAGNLGGYSQTFTYAYAIRNLLTCFDAVNIVSTATVTGLAAPTIALLTGITIANTETTYPSASVTTTLTVTGCDVAVALSVGTPNLLTRRQYSWSHSVQPVTPASLRVPWGGSSTVTAEAGFNRQITSAQYLANFVLTITNPSAGPMLLTNLRLSCAYGATVKLPCGAYTGTGSTGLVVPASGTTTCNINNLNIPASPGADFTQPCTITTSNSLGTATELTGLILNFNAANTFTDISDCARWSVTCTAPTGSAFWVPLPPAGLPNGVEVCGNDNNAPIPNQRFTVTLAGGWQGTGTQPGACSAPVQATCTSRIDTINTGATTQATTGGAQTSSLTIQATPIDCPVVPSPLPPSPPPLADTAPGFSGVTRMEPRISIRVTSAAILGDFAWSMTQEIDPSSQPIVVGQSGSATYSIRAVRGNADDSGQLQRRISGEITLENMYDKPIPISNVFAVLSGAKVAAVCNGLQLPSSLPASATASCTFQANSALLDTGEVDAQVAYPNTAETSSAGSVAQFNFASADVSQATAVCAFVNATFAANSGMRLAKTRDSSAAVLPVDGTSVRVCGSAEFIFDVEYSPKLSLDCGVQQVVSAATLVPDTPSQGPVRQAEATATITVTGCPGFLEASPTPVIPAGSRPLVVEVLEPQQQEGQDAVWNLTLMPVGVSNGRVQQAQGAEGQLTFKIAYSKQVQRVTRYVGQIKITNNAVQPYQLESVVVELVSPARPDTPTVAQVTAHCPSGEVSADNPLKVQAGSSVNCQYTLNGQQGGDIVATVAVVEADDTVESLHKRVYSLMDADVSEACANLVTGLAGTTLTASGKLTADGAVQSQEVCGNGSKQIVFSTKPASGAPCTLHPVVAVARLEPSGAFTAAPIMATAQVHVQLIGCGQFASAPEAAINTMKNYKTRYLTWNVRKQLTPAVNGTFDYTTGGANRVNVSVLYTRSYEPGQKLTLTGSIIGEADQDGDVQADKSKIMVFPLCAPSQSCQSLEIKPNCNKTVSNNAFGCRFRVDRLPVVSGVIVPKLYSTAGQSYPHLAKPQVYNPVVSNGRRTIGRCAVLTDMAQITSPAVLKRVGAVRLPPQCVSSFAFSYQYQFESVQCGRTYSFNSLAKATPVDSAATTGTATVSFKVACT